MAVVWHDRSRATDVRVLAGALRHLGAQPGHRIAVLAGNTPLAVALHQAAAVAGLTLVPLDPNDAPARLSARLSSCDAAVADERVAARIPLEGLPHLVASPDGAVRSARGHLGPVRDGTEAIYVLATSGTGGAPKEVRITATMLEAHRKAASARLGDGGESVWLGVLPLHRVGGLALVDRCLATGATLRLEEKFDASRVTSALRHEGVTHASLVPTMLRRLLEAWGPRPPPPSLRCLLVGGDRAPEALVQDALARGWPIWCTYGLTEACSQVATATPEERRALPGTSGRPLDGVTVHVTDGEIVVSGPTVAGGGPLRTGDMGRLDGEGRLFVEGRRDDRITTGGVKVDPVEVEDCLAAHPGVAEAGVAGLPDPEWGQRVVAFVVPRRGRGTMPSDLRAWCAARLSPAHVPKAFREVVELPRGPEGKLRRVALRELHATVPT